MIRPRAIVRIFTIQLIQGSRALSDLLRVGVSSSYDPPPSGEGSDAPARGAIRRFTTRNWLEQES